MDSPGIPNVLDRVVADGQPACALTDHGVLYGAIDFYEAARERGVNPIVGTEAYVAPGARQARDAQAKSPLPPDAAGEESHRLRKSAEAGDRRQF